MNNRNLFTKILAVGGTLLTWFPLAAPAVFSLIRLFESGRFRYDFLMPAELFPLVLAGGALLVWAAVRARLRLRLILSALITALVSIVLGQGLAVVSGLATGATEPDGLAWMVVVASLVIYTLAVMALGVGGVLLLRGLNPPVPEAG